MLLYFNHDNYYKINNKPVFYIHHPWFISDSDLDLFERMLNQACLQNRFAGIYLVVNNMERNYDKRCNYKHHPSYKNGTLDYTEHVRLDVSKKENEKNASSMFFDFNNTARLFLPDKSHLVSRIYNNTYNEQNKFFKLLIDRYKDGTREEINKILTINSWNEWGENMAIEPSNERGYAFLNMIKMNLLRLL